MKLIKFCAILSIVHLAGCTVFAAKDEFPVAPAELLDPCPDLELIPQTTQLSVLTETVASNYSLYHNCRLKDASWIEWYTQQKQALSGGKK